MQTRILAETRTVGGVASFSMRFDPPAYPVLVGHARPWRLGAALLALVVLVLAGTAGRLVLLPPAASGVGSPPPASPSVPGPPPWVEINRPIQLFALAGTDFARQPLSLRARRREAFDERQDLLTYGRFGDGNPVFELSVRRRGTAPPDTADFFVTMVRLASDAGLSLTRNALPNLTPTRFGDFATADVTLTNGPASLSCLGFRLEPGPVKAPIDIAGLACRPIGKGMDRALLGCVLDRIDLVSAGDDEDVRSFFVDAERRRGGSCGPSQLLAAGSRSLWLDSEATPPAMRHLAGSRVR